jgi:hypothetical protein
MERIMERLTEAGMNPDLIAKVADALVALGGTTTEAEAVRFYRFDAQKGDLSRSNGNTAWAVYREGRLVTVMLRRDNQPSTPQALRVDRVRLLV